MFLSSYSCPSNSSCTISYQGGIPYALPVSPSSRFSYASRRPLSAQPAFPHHSHMGHGLDLTASSSAPSSLKAARAPRTIAPDAHPLELIQLMGMPVQIKQHFPPAGDKYPSMDGADIDIMVKPDASLALAMGALGPAPPQVLPHSFPPNSGFLEGDRRTGSPQRSPCLKAAPSPVRSEDPYCHKSP